MDGRLVVLDGSTFFVSDARGDCLPTGDAGFFHADVRHLSTWRLLADGEPLRVLTSRNGEHFEGHVFATPGSPRAEYDPAVSVRRDRLVADGLHEDLTVENHSDRRTSIRLELEVGADFADLFDVKAGRERLPATGVAGDGRLTFLHERDGFRRASVVTVNQGGDLRPDRICFNLDLAPKERWSTCIDVTCVVGDEPHPPRQAVHRPDGSAGQMAASLEQWLARAPKLETSLEELGRTYRQSLADLAALRLRPEPPGRGPVPAAGLPWFMTLFGRDSLITAYQALPFHPELAAATLETLAGLQAQDRDDFRDAEPGKIPHEVRTGEAVALGAWPSPYFGSHDSTPLFCILLDEYERWTGDVDLVRRLEPAARAALGWIEDAGDPDGDGYLEYRSRSANGLVNHGWKDSADSMRFADGRVAAPPIAVCEVQGYAYDAKRRLARLARAVWDDPRLSERLEWDAATLKQRFDADFWNDRLGCYVLALDRAKQQVDAVTSNAGQLLWTGIVDDRRAARLAATLMAPDMFSGWGIRTMATGCTAYNPISYHNGSVWPHDTALIAEGLRRHGFREQASRLALAMIEAATSFGHRLPEVFAGFDRSGTGMTVDHPTASSPQAWAAGTPLLAIRTLLGMDVVDGRLRLDPHLPEGMDRLALEGIPFRGRLERVPVSG